MIFRRFSFFAQGKQYGDHDKQVFNEFLKVLQDFKTARVGNKVELNIPGLENHNLDKNPSMLVEELRKDGWASPDWQTTKLSNAQILSAVSSMAVLHATGLAYKMSAKNSLDDLYPWLVEDLYTCNMTKELLARHLDEYLHCLSFIPGTENIVSKLRKIEQNVFQYLVQLRRPNDALGSR